MLDLHHHLDFAVTSYEACDAKPSPGIFHAAAARATNAARLFGTCDAAGTISPAQMLHVGASLTQDFLAAKACGMRALLLDVEGSVVHESLQEAERLHTLEALPAKIDEILGVGSGLSSSET